jgi:aconitate hydratase
MSLPNPFNTLRQFQANGATHALYSLPALEEAGFKISRLPVSIRLVLESLLRNCDGKRVAGR